MSANTILFERDSFAGALIYDFYGNIESSIFRNFPNAAARARARLLTSLEGEELRLTERGAAVVSVVAMVALSAIA